MNKTNKKHSKGKTSRLKIEVRPAWKKSKGHPARIRFNEWDYELMSFAQYRDVARRYLCEARDEIRAGKRHLAVLSLKYAREWGAKARKSYALLCELGKGVAL